MYGSISLTVSLHTVYGYIFAYVQTNVAIDLSKRFIPGVFIFLSKPKIVLQPEQIILLSDVELSLKNELKSESKSNSKKN